jgi:H+/Cl- antiporter ClcA
VITCIILLIISGFAFSWLSYWVRRYVEEIAEHRIGEAAQKIRNAHKEWRFLLHALVGTVSLVLAGLMFVLGKMI